MGAIPISNLSFYISLQNLIQRCKTLYGRLVTHVTEKSRKFNKTICENYDGIVKTITEVPEDTVKLVKLIKYVEELDTKDLAVIKVRIISIVGKTGCLGGSTHTALHNMPLH